jgi:stress response protein SCP2
MRLSPSQHRLARTVTTLAPGQNLSLLGPAVSVSVDGAVDLTALVLSQDGKVVGDADMVFFNQPQAPGLSLSGLTLTAKLDQLRRGVNKVVLVVSPEAEGTTFGSVTGLTMTVNVEGAVVATFAPAALSTETALILGELYRRGPDWRVRAVGQGYASGLAGVATDFGVDIGDSAPAPAAPTPPAPAAPAEAPDAPISLEKRRLVNLEKKLEASNPAMLSLVKQAGVSLQKRGLGEHTARVALCIDISISMKALFQRGAVQRLAERVLAVGLRFDDDGEVDVFLFGRDAHAAEPLNLANSSSYWQDLLRKRKLEGGTYYGKVLKLVREHYFGSGTERKDRYRAELPVYLMFITDGATMDKDMTIKQVQWGSHEPLFIQFMGIGEDQPGKKRGFLASLTATNFDFLQKLDDLTGRLVDNANFFAVSQNDLLGASPISDEHLFERMMSEYPDWLPQARQHGLL